jgi:peptide/nickel transport system permease protein
MQQDFVDAASALGLPRRHILLREILPNLSTPLMVEYGLRLTWSIALIAAISFLGFGIQPPNSDWGLMLNQNRNGLVLQPWAVLLPVICISVFTVGTNLVTEGLSRALARIDAASSR